MRRVVDRIEEKAMRSLAAAFISFAAVGLLATPAFASDANGNHANYVWVTAGDTAMAPDGSTITLTGQGTLSAGPDKAVSGGGTFTSSGGGSGTWSATAVDEFVSYGPAGPEPFKLPPGSTGGKAKLQVSLSDGRSGVLTIFCVLGTPPPSVMEGINVVLGSGVSGEYTKIVSGNTIFIAM
jgi:hypothetical protein